MCFCINALSVSVSALGIIYKRHRPNPFGESHSTSTDTNTLPPAPAVPDASRYGLIHFHMPGMADCASESVQHSPCRRVGGKAKDSMERFSGCQMPGGRTPDRQWRSGVVKDRAGCGEIRRTLWITIVRISCARPGASTVRANTSVRHRIQSR